MQSAFTIQFTKEKLITWGIYLSLFLFLLYPYTDYDWGWHYKYGEYFLNNWQIMWQDSWSWTMSGYLWVNHEWIYDPLLFTLTNLFGFTGLSVVGALVGVLAFHFSIRGMKISFVEKAFLAFFFGFFVSSSFFQGLRSQIVGLLFLSVNLYLIRKSLYERTRAYLFLPLFYFLYVNFHGTFVIGLFFFALSVLQSFYFHFRMRNGIAVFDPYSVKYLGIFIASIFITFLNPFTYQVYLEAWRHFRNPLLTTVMEWIPVDFMSGYFMVMVFYMTLVAGFIAIKTIKGKLKTSDFYVIISAAVVVYLSFTARRYVPIMAVVTIPILAYYVSKFPVRISSYKASLPIMIMVVLIALQIGIHNRVSTKNLLSYDMSAYCANGSRCSMKSLEYIKKNPPQGRGLNFYDWGGWMIGNEFPAKLFIDGRMHLWKDEKGYQPMEQYTRMYYNGDMELFKSYDFDWVFIPKGKNLDTLIKNGKAGNYKVAYEDDTTVYYVKEK